MINARLLATVIIRQDYLFDPFQTNNIGSEHEGNLSLYFSYSANKVECSELPLTFLYLEFTQTLLSVYKY